MSREYEIGRLQSQLNKENSKVSGTGTSTSTTTGISHTT